MIRRLLLFFLPVAGLTACTGDGGKTSATTPAAPPSGQANSEQVKLQFMGPELLDSSVYVMYPLPLNATESEDEGVYKSRNREVAYWNIAFHNVQTGESHLLANRKIIIERYSAAETASELSDYAPGPSAKPVKGGPGQLASLLYYAVKSADYNHDGRLNDQDPTYLFISDKEGRNFRQISPDGYTVDSWRLLKSANKVLIQARQDTDNNQAFDENDSSTPLVYTLRTGGVATAVFDKAFNDEMKKTLHTQWLTKP